MGSQHPRWGPALLRVRWGGVQQAGQKVCVGCYWGFPDKIGNKTEFSDPKQRWDFILLAMETTFLLWLRTFASLLSVSIPHTSWCVLLPSLTKNVTFIRWHAFSSSCYLAILSFALKQQAVSSILIFKLCFLPPSWL